MTRTVIIFTESEERLLDRLSSKTGLSYHDLIIKLARAHDRHKRS